MELEDQTDFVHKSAPTAPRVLVLLASYNGANWIRDQIESILRQRSVHVRLIVRDDGSADSTIAVIREFVAADPRVELVSAIAPSGSAAQNFFALIRICDAEGSEFVALSDQDDVWHPDKLLQAVQSLGLTRSAGYSSAVEAVWPSGKARLQRQNCSVTESDFLLEGAGQGCTFVLSAALYAQLRSLLMRYQQLTTEIHFHDWAIYALTRVQGLTWVFNPNSTMLYRQHGNNDTGARSSLGGVMMRFARIRRGWYLEQLLRISALCDAVAASNPLVSNWHATLRATNSMHRRLAIARFCFRGGRRRSLDNVVLIVSALLGWV